MSFEDAKKTIGDLKNLVSVDNCIGEPIELENKIIVPVSKFGIAWGAGSKDNMDGGAAGASVEPVSVMIVDKSIEGFESVRILKLNGENDMNDLIADLGIVAVGLLKEFLMSSNQEDTTQLTDKIKNNVDIENNDE